MASQSNGSPKWVRIIGRLVTGLVSIATIIGVVIAYLSYVNQPHFPENSPYDTVLQLCYQVGQGLDSVDSVLYEVYTTDNYKSEVSEPEFVQKWKNGQCQISNVTKLGDTAIGDVNIQRSTGTFKYRVTFQKMLTQDTQGQTVYLWLIDKTM